MGTPLAEESNINALWTAIGLVTSRHPKPMYEDFSKFDTY